ncbi:MAG: hypothetical protein HC828_09435 [Blastochloris sp.]|nr:hypothetical protein [Blastochloris sp.]
MVEHDIRVDHWNPADQIEWFGKEIARLRDDIARSRERAAEIKRHPERVSCAAANYNIQVRDMQRDQERLKDAIKRLYAFAEQHDVAVTPDLLNGTRYRTRQAAASRAGEQLMMF